MVRNRVSSTACCSQQDQMQWAHLMSEFSCVIFTLIGSPSLPSLLTSARLRIVEAIFFSGTLSPRSQKMQILSSDMPGCWAMKVSFHSGLQNILDQFLNNNKPRLILHVCRRTNFSGANLFIIHHDCDIAVHVLFSDPNILSSSTLLTAEVSRDDGDVQSSSEHLDREKPGFSPWYN